MTQPTDRPGIDQLTSDMLDQLYDELWHLRLAQAGADLALQAACRMTEEQRARAEKAQAAITAVRDECMARLENRHSHQFRRDQCEAILAVLDQHDQTTKEPT
ncbi:hypothetical protein [Streptomyces lateritius]|uniref:hypothetical protein n=1 Tax=Streptomyces lateritius TaxID=67313 RepID=UPI001C8B3D49|nr:hypothetical protein [Streptomyces lateritius]MBX9425469.1 hypothetical protein [Streptomyces lateritius]